MHTCIYSVQVVVVAIVRMQRIKAAMVAVVAMSKGKLQSLLVRVTQSLLVKPGAVFRQKVSVAMFGERRQLTAVEVGADLLSTGRLDTRLAAVDLQFVFKVHHQIL